MLSRYNLYTTATQAFVSATRKRSLFIFSMWVDKYKNYNPYGLKLVQLYGGLNGV